MLICPFLPFLILELAAGAADHLIGIVGIRPHGAEAGALEELLHGAVSGLVAVAAAVCTAEIIIDHVGNEQVAVGIEADAGRVEVRRQALAQQREFVVLGACHMDIFTEGSGGDIDLAAGNGDGCHAVLGLVFAVRNGAGDIFRPGRPMGRLGEQAEVIVALDRLPGLAAVGGLDEGGNGIFIGGNVAAGIDDIGVVRVNGNCLAALSAPAVAHDLDEIGDVDLLHGLAAVGGLENAGLFCREIGASAEEIHRIVIGRVNGHGIDREQTSVRVVDKAEELIPAFRLIIVLVGAADVGTRIHDLLAGDNAGHESAAADLHGAPVIAGFDGFRGSKAVHRKGSHTAAEQSRRNHGRNCLSPELHK